MTHPTNQPLLRIVMRPFSALLLIGCALFLATSSPLAADEIVVGEREQTAAGDFDCCDCPSQVSKSMAMLMADSTGTLSAGELWQFFSRQGISELNELTICLDLEPGNQRQAFGLTGVELRIEDPDQPGHWITDVSMGNNSLVVPDYEISSFKPEARLRVALGYDFMNRFSASSKERFRLRYSSDASEVMPVFSVEGESALPQNRFSFSLLAGFVVFWVAVFVLLSRVTRSQVQTPVNNAGQSTSGKRPSTRHALPV